MQSLEASVAAHKVMHPGTELPVATMELAVEEFASKYSSVSAIEGAYNLQMMEAFEEDGGSARVRRTDARLSDDA